MGERAHKTFQRRWCRRFGQESAWVGEPGSDSKHETRTLSLEVKRTTSGVVRNAWVEQAQRQGRSEQLPWVLVIGRKANDAAPIAVVDAAWLASILPPGFNAAAVAADERAEEDL